MEDYSVMYTISQYFKCHFTKLYGTEGRAYMKSMEDFFECLEFSLMGRAGVLSLDSPLTQLEVDIAIMKMWENSRGGWILCRTL